MEAFDQALFPPATRTRWPRLALAGLIAGLLAGAAWTIPFFLSSKGVVAKSGRPAVNVPIARTATSTVPPRAELPVPAKTESKAPARSPEFQRLVELRAYAIWVGQGRPEGLAGELVREKNWTEAETQIENQIKCRAFIIWQKQGRPTGAAGESVADKNMRAAERELLKETEDDLLRHPLD